MGSMTGWSGMDALSGLVGGGNPLAFSGLVGYWSADYGVYQDGAVQFTSSHSDYLGIASNSTLQPGSADFWVAGWAYLDTSAATTQGLVAKWTGTAATSEYALYTSSSRFNWRVCNGSSIYTATANTFGAPSTGTWYFIVCYWGASNNLCGISVNGGAFDTTATTGTVAATATPFNMGGWNNGSGSFYNGRLDEVAFGKSPVGGIASQATTIRDALYNSGVGKIYSDLTSAQKTDWGLVSWWGLGEETGIRYDSHGSNHLAENFAATLIDPTTPKLNGGFETAGAGGADVFGSWTEEVAGTSTVNSEGTTVKSGAKACRLDIDGSNSTGGVYQAILAANRRYSYSLWAKASSGTPTIYVGDLAGVGYDTKTLDTTYTQYTGTTRGVSGGTLQFKIRNNSAASKSIYIDDVTLSPIDIPGTAGIAAGLATDANFALQFNGSTQYLADPGTGGDFDIDNEDAVITVWCYLDYKTAGATPHVISKYQNGFNRNYRIWYDVTANRFNFGVYETGAAASQEVAANTYGAISIGTWYLVTVYHDATLHQIGISVNGGAFDTAAVAFNPSPGGGNFVVGQDTLLLNGWPGRIDAVGFAKPASGCAAQAADMRTSVFNSGIGKKYVSLTSGEKTSWGLAHWWDMENGTLSQTNSQTSGQDLTNPVSATKIGGVNYLPGLVSKWLDQSTSALNWVQTTVTKRPSYQTTVFGTSKPALVFDGVDDFMSVASAGALNSSERTIFVVLTLADAATTRIFYGSGGSSLYMATDSSETNLVSWQNAATTQKTRTLASGAGSKVHAARWTVSGGNPTVDQWVNTTTSSTAYADGKTDPVATTYYLGSLQGTTNFFDSAIAAVVVFNVALPDGSVINIINFLRGKFGI